jgi:glycosyltransferase involved in cell wall biosynthesis
LPIFLKMEPSNSPELSQQPLVTVCIGTYQCESFIERTLKGVESQTYQNFRCILSDDNSSDGTVAICDSFATRDSRFVLQAHSQNVGWISNINRMLDQDLGEYFMLISHDDEILPQCIETLMRALSNDPDGVVVYSDVEELLPDSEERLAHQFEALKPGEARTKLARRIMWGKEKGWLAYHGIVRSAKLNFARRLRSNFAGEFEADRIWVLALVSSGSFVRVPQVLWLKHRIIGSVAGSWDYSMLSTAAVYIDGACFILGSKFSVWEKIQLLCFLPLCFLRILRWRLIRAFKG